MFDGSDPGSVSPIAMMFSLDAVTGVPLPLERDGSLDSTSGSSHTSGLRTALTDSGRPLIQLEDLFDRNGPLLWNPTIQSVLLIKTRKITIEPKE
ncbi:hypothetical protein Mapa_014034 [Marchantia paleacea]|nr:hypothetical protein Mapa_014034 [Marchantia paleacea]